MSLARVHNFSISLDGFATGEGQDARCTVRPRRRTAAPMDVRHPVLARDGRQARRQRRHRRRLLAAVRPGSAPRSWVRTSSATPDGTSDLEWKGAWGSNLPFHTPTFILTHQPRPSIEMEGGTTFHFIDASPAEALETAREAADGQDVRLGGGATMIRDFLAAGLVDHMHIVVVPILLGRGVRLGTDWRASKRTIRSRPSPRPAESRM